MTYFNEYEPYLAPWLKNLYPTATIDTRSIVDVRADDVREYDRAHFFAGIAGWEYALHLAGWTTPTTQDAHNNAGPSQFNRHSQALNVQAATITPGQTTNSSTAQTEKRGALASVFSGWLMGFPKSWDSTAPSGKFARSGK